MSQLGHTNVGTEKTKAEVLNLLQFCELILEQTEPQAPCLLVPQTQLLVGDRSLDIKVGTLQVGNTKSSSLLVTARTVAFW